MNKGNRFSSLKSSKSNPFKQDKKKTNTKPMNSSSRFKHLSSENESKNTFKQSSYSRDRPYNRDSRHNRDSRDGRRSTRGRYNNRYNNRKYYKSNKSLEDSVFKPSCLKNTGIESLMVPKTSQKNKKTKVKPIKTDYKYDVDELSQEEKELNKKLILQYQTTLEQDDEEEELKKINDSWEDAEESENTILTEPQEESEESEEEVDEYSAENYTQQFI